MLIDPKIIQHFINSAGGFTLVEDGLFGLKSYTAGRTMLARARQVASYADDRTYIQLCQMFLNWKIGAGLLVDGIAGSATLAAVTRFKWIAPVTVPRWPRQVDVPAFFGEDPHYAPMGYVTPPFPMFAEYDRLAGHRVSRFMCHILVKAHIQRILERTLAHYGLAAIRRLNLDIFSGCKVIRLVTGGVGYSMHSWGIAYDCDAAHNEFRDTWASSVMDGAEYAAFVQFWYDEGAINLGRERNYDPMHFQFARL